MQLRSTLP